MHHERHFLGVGREGNLGGSPGAHLSYEARLVVVGGDGDVDLLWLCALPDGVDLAVVAVAEQSALGGGEEADGILLLVGHLRVLARGEAAAVDVEGAVLLAQVVEALLVGSPHGRAVLAFEGGEFGVLAAVEHPDVAGDGRGVVLAPFVLVALAVVVEYLSLGVDADVLHGQCGVELGPSALHAHLVHLRELAAGEEVALCRGHDVGGEEHMVVVLEGDGCLRAAVGGESGGGAAVGWNDVHVHAALAGGGEGDLGAVGTPHGVGVVGGVGGQLTCLSARGGHAVDVALVGEGDSGTVGGNGGIAHPQRTLLCEGCEGGCEERSR